MAPERSDCSLKWLREQLQRAGAQRLLVKVLAANDNSKNQIYLGYDVEGLPISDVVEADESSKGARYKATVDFSWLTPDGELSRAPHAKLILYPQYPEVRFSGFLLGSKGAPSPLLRSDARIPGRVLCFGVTEDDEVIGFVAGPDSRLAEEIEEEEPIDEFGVFQQLALRPGSPADTPLDELIDELRELYGHGERWHAGRRLNTDGDIVPYNAPNAGGYTLEALLGIPPNARAEPDIAGFELKALTGSSPITLMTPEPRGGIYQDEGVISFLLEYGRLNDDRIDFTGRHRVGDINSKTGLTLRLFGYKPENDSLGTITDAEGDLRLVPVDSSAVAAAWPFTLLLKHWADKHTSTIIVFCDSKNTNGKKKYRFGPEFVICRGGGPLRLLYSFHVGSVFYDPGIRVKNITTDRDLKRRNQFRVSTTQLDTLYDNVKERSLETDS